MERKQTFAQNSYILSQICKTVDMIWLLLFKANEEFRCKSL